MISKKIVKTVAVASLVAISSVNLFGCIKSSESEAVSIQVEQDATGGNGDKIKEKEVTTGGKINIDEQTSLTGTTPIQNTGDPIKDEASWPIGKFGYHEPPMELRTFVDLGGGKISTKSYRISIHSNIYGDLEMQYNTGTGQRTLFKAGGGAADKLMIISEDNPISIEQALEDLKMGDSIARNFGK